MNEELLTGIDADGLERYLARIGLDGADHSSEALQLAHVRSIPYENLAIRRAALGQDRRPGRVDRPGPRRAPSRRHGGHRHHRSGRLRLGFEHRFDLDLDDAELARLTPMRST